ncbi:maleylpyruvate isomerase family mycothiol-dependent enzyme [Streptomyces cinnabarinus]|uniref:Maleylpyruvate isomerase family mycothiol-dependent enzyme n=1 Tax=Streptomyces cinnabarinus TaxID=67287 RepID=A0ABY7KRG6_9ACTN|nr:maleylpyruvate isomerase family mycothiol-dependent enzyme [Streptomyces cinnabarinus]WAZ27210.1 maleylpyruvate isomerase family mycothiol-dependent enzyme [Streptomyces cinnabarinus]
MIPVAVVLETDERWRIVDEQRTTLADLLEALPPSAWETPTACGDWRVRDVVAHLTLAPRFSYGDLMRDWVRARGNLDRLIHDTAVREAARPTPEILSNLRAIVGSRRLAPMTTPREPLLDILVHGNDIARALGLQREMPPAAARDAADRVCTTRFPLRLWPRPRARLVATDIEWEAGEGEEIRAPIATLLLLLTGRTPAESEA